MQMSTGFLIIDAQYDFCDPNGTLFVPGAPDDMRRIAELINVAGHQLDQLFLTLDTHQVLDISHPGFWQNKAGKHPAPFTAITFAELNNGEWLPRFHQQEVKTYLEKLEQNGEFVHYIWPEHCLAGTKGASLTDVIATAIREWSFRNNKNYITLHKGTHPLTEHFGIFQAQVPMEDVPETQFNFELLEQLASFDLLLIAGEARSHCVATSLKQLLLKDRKLASKIIILEDGMSDVNGLGHLADPIFSLAKEHGVRFMSCAEVAALLIK